MRKSGVMLVVVLAGTSGVIRAGDNVWTSHGPGGGDISALAVSPKNAGTIYAGTRGGVFRSTDGGANWNSVRPGFTSLVAVDPQDPSTVYAVDYFGGGRLFKSTDSGQSWNALSSAPLIGTLAIDPKNPSTLYAVSGIASGSGSYFYYGWSGVSMSTDGGSSWNAVNSGLPTNFQTPLLALDPQSPETLYTMGGSTLFKTTDGGRSWSAPLRQKLIELNNSESATCDDWGFYLTEVTGRPAPGPEQISCFSDGNRDAVITADQYLADVVRNNAPNFGIVAGLSALVVDPRNSSTLYGGTARGIVISTDGGLSWNASNSGLPNGPRLLWVNTLVMDPGNPGTLYATIDAAGSPTELYKSTDGGATWIAAGAGLTSCCVAISVAIDSQNLSVLYAGTTSGMFKSSDGAASWSPSNSGLSATSVSALAVDPQNRGSLFAATQTAGGHPGGLFKSTDAGTSWADTGLPYRVDALAVAPQSALVYAAVDAATIAAGGQECCPVFKSTNGGGSWVSTGSFGDAISRLIVDPQNAATLYAATNIGVYKSTDAAAHWSAVNSGLPFTPLINTLALDPQNSNVLYATTYESWPIAGGQIFRTTDGGRSWSMMNTAWDAALFDVALVSIDPQNAGTLYVAVSLFDCSWDVCPSDYWERVKAEPGPGIFKSADRGQSWVKVDWPSGLVTFDPKNPNTLYALGTNVFKSSDGGASWNVVGPGLTANVSALVVDAQDSNTVYAATQGGGVFAITIGAQ
jgi:photosystem II stability/assembly factor-like uncharacterized protein